MLEPERVRDICASMMRHVAPTADERAPDVTVKCRIGVDDHDSYEELHHFIDTVAASGVRHFVVHARKCLLNGLSPHENRTIPPLRYDWVYRLKDDFPHLRFTLNGGVQSIQHAKQLLDATRLDGVMIGRAAYYTPWNFRDADRLLFGEARNPNLSRPRDHRTVPRLRRRSAAEMGRDRADLGDPVPHADVGAHEAAAWAVRGRERRQGVQARDRGALRRQVAAETRDPRADRGSDQGRSG
ncbi:hypothetical protein PINS_up019386 [Pythium insidiosum]|nr:hypothetical protein PINS_up019386 [Pythium insidiosum]